MGNLLNLFAGILSLIIGAALAYTFWGPVQQFTSMLDTEPRLIAQTAFFVIILAIVFLNPIGMVLTDDAGQ